MPQSGAHFGTALPLRSRSNVHQEQTQAAFPRLWVVLILIVWAAGLYQGTILTKRQTATADRFRDIPMYQPAREVLGNEITADYLTDYRKRNKTVDRFWRAQYAVVPTVLRIQYNADKADQNARAILKLRRNYHRLLEFKDAATLNDMRQRLNKISNEIGALVHEHRIAKGVVLFTVVPATDD